MNAIKRFFISAEAAAPYVCGRPCGFKTRGKAESHPQPSAHFKSRRRGRAFICAKAKLIFAPESLGCAKCAGFICAKNLVDKADGKRALALN